MEKSQIQDLPILQRGLGEIENLNDAQVAGIA